MSCKLVELVDLCNNKFMSSLAPIIVFIYNRPEHTRQTVEALLANELADKSDLFIYSDAAKDDLAIDKVREVREYIKTIKGFKSINIIEREKNIGLAHSIIDGVTTIVNEYGRVIVLEDDLVTSPYFLSYINDALELYEHNESVVSIHGYMYPGREKLPDYFFLRGADCWGWATWQRGWSLFNPDAQYLLNEIKKQNLQELFNFSNTYNYTGMLQNQIDGRISSWAICWYASAFLADKYTLYPRKSFVQNIGMDGSGTHCGINNFYKKGKLSATYKPIRLIPVVDSRQGRKKIEKFLKKNAERNIVFRVLQKICKKIKRLLSPKNG
ncbi:hypothetical protein NO2_0164 [Candidatus Termititenax persephonae]|uniref:Uncharacterized protein n=1 Tax=Candidatus Termititenax persephonae TaxID=2218525 RepID=A0A388TEQ6_9BACT|nr:hypothetical protein NO2_0164 [Candidatus Termititenax persephonae]